jgi:hypothetical protein
MDRTVTCIPGMEGLLRRRDLPSICRQQPNDPTLQLFIKETVTPRPLQKDVSENFNFHMTLRHHQNYKLAAECILSSLKKRTHQRLLKDKCN